MVIDDIVFLPVVNVFLLSKTDHMPFDFEQCTAHLSVINYYVNNTNQINILLYGSSNNFQCPLLLTWFNFNPSMDK